DPPRGGPPQRSGGLRPPRRLVGRTHLRLTHAAREAPERRVDLVVRKSVGAGGVHLAHCNAPFAPAEIERGRASRPRVRSAAVTTAAIEAHGLVKRYGEKVALGGIDLV